MQIVREFRLDVGVNCKRWNSFAHSGQVLRIIFLLVMGFLVVVAGPVSESLDIYRVNNNAAGPWTVITGDSANHRHGIKVDSEFGGLTAGGHLSCRLKP